MKKLDLIIDALQQAYEDTPGWCDAVNEALYAARELKALKPVAWVVRRTTSEGDLVDGVWTCDSDDIGAIPVYVLDEVTK